jgi:DNA-directed RNA polymerase specialized sigma24 family protein
VLVRVHGDRRGEVSDDFDEFCAQEFPRLVGALSLWCADRDVAEEIAQEALAHTYRDLKRVSDLDRPGAWTRRVAMNLARSSSGAGRRSGARRSAPEAS